jgi:hypothetical protein
VRADNAPRPFRRAMRCPHGPASKRASPPGHGICRRGCAKRPRRITCGRHVWSLIARGRGSRLVTGKGNRSHATSFLLPDRDHDDGRLLTHRNICPEIESCGCPWLPVENRESSVSCPHLGTILECPTAPIERGRFELVFLSALWALVRTASARLLWKCTTLRQFEAEACLN